MGTKIIIVDENDRVIDYKERELLEQNDIYRVSALLIVNSQGQVLLARRALSKKQHPGLWGPSVAGTVDEGETYDDNIIKEADEELGLEHIRPIKKNKIRISGDYNYFGQWYILRLDKAIDDFRIDPVEVAEVRWINKEDLLEEVENSPEKFTASSKFWREVLSSFSS